MKESSSINTVTLASQQDELKRGIWPRSVPLWMAAFYVALFIIRPWDQLIPLLGKLHFERVYVICMFVVLVITNKKRFQMSFQTLTVILFFLGIGLSAVFAINPSLGLDTVYYYLTLVVFYFVLIMVVRTPYDLVFMVTCYIVTMTVYLMKSQWEFFFHSQHVYDMGVVRLIGIESTFGGPNSLAMSIVVSLPMLLFLWFAHKQLSHEWPIFWKKWFPRFLLVYFVLAVSSIILTNSRSGMLSFILFTFLATFRGKGIGRKLGYILFGAFILLMFWQLMPEDNRSRFRTIWDPKSGPKDARVSAEGRIEGYKAGMTMFDRFPITGVGVGNFIDYRNNFVDGITLDAHNLIGQVLGETGLVGGITFSLMVLVTLGNCHKVRSLSRGNHSVPALNVLSNLGRACRDAVILLGFEGIFGHNLLRFNWLWLGAFSVLALEFVRMEMEGKALKNNHSQVVS